jgi:hypothetical protein
MGVVDDIKTELHYLDLQLDELLALAAKDRTHRKEADDELPKLFASFLGFHKAYKAEKRRRKVVDAQAHTLTTVQAALDAAQQTIRQAPRCELSGYVADSGPVAPDPMDYAGTPWLYESALRQHTAAVLQHNPRVTFQAAQHSPAPSTPTQRHTSDVPWLQQQDVMLETAEQLRQGGH